MIRDRERTNSFGPTIIWFGLPLLALTGAIVYDVAYQPPWLAPYIPNFIAGIVAAVLAIAPLVACLVQTVSRDRQAQKLDNVVIPAIIRTRYYELAIANLKSVTPASITDPHYRAPLLLFATIISFCSLMSFMGLFWPDTLKAPVFILSGLYGIAHPAELQSYQAGTLVAAAVAFIGAYLALFQRLLGQLNTNDIYPISFHYYSAWLLAAMFIAAIYRHAMPSFGLGENIDAVVILVSFAIGALPAPFFSALAHAAFKYFGITGDKVDPDKQSWPTNLNLLMIDGLANEKIDRLAELGISDAQVLSHQNPFTLWARLPFDLPLIVDWIAQAQLYVCVREEGLRKARALEVGDIHKFVAVLLDANAGPELCAALDLRPSFVAPLLASLNENPAYVRLKEVRTAMLAPSPPAAALVQAATAN